MKDLVFKLTPQGVISGRVTDETGEPIDSVSVAVMQWGYSQGKRLLRPVRAALANDLGEYRIANLSPGSYYVVAHRGSTIASRAHAPSAVVPETPEEGYTDTYYPGSLHPAAAILVQVTPGSELRGVDIQFRKARVFRVRGQVVDAAGQPVTEALVALMASTHDSVLNMGRFAGRGRIPGGKFEVTGVLPGSYYLMALVTRNRQTLYAGLPVHVGDQNVTDVVIRIPGAVDIAGRVQVSGEDLQSPPPRQQQAFSMENVRISLFPAEGFGLASLFQTNAQADGSFVLRNVVPDKFRVRVSGAPPGSYLKSILRGGREASDGTVDLTGGGAIDIILAMGAAEITGSVVDADDKPASGVAVTLVPEDANQQGRIDLFHFATSDQNGQFHVEDVAPGGYKIFAWQEVESGATQDPELRRLFEGEAKSLRISENGRETVKLKAISAEDVAKALGNRPNI